MRFGVLFVDKVRVIGGNDLNIILARERDKEGIHLFLPFIHLLVAVGLLRLMALELDIVVFAKEIFEPFDRLLRLLENALLHHLFRAQLLFRRGELGEA